MSWRNWPGAPVPGTDLGAVPAPGEVALWEGSDFGIVIAHGAQGVMACVDLCPHQDLPLSWRTRDILSADGAALICSNHDARFALADGICTSGPCVGTRLDMVPIRIENGQVLLGDA